MKLLKELFSILAEGKKKKKPISKSTAAAVYHRDYEKTKHKAYRNYDPNEHRRKTAD